MQMNASKAARHKIFHGKPSTFCGQKICIQKVDNDEIQEIMDKAVPKQQKKATKFRMRLFNGTYL